MNELNLYGTDLFGDEIKPRGRGPVAERFTFPPFTFRTSAFILFFVFTHQTVSASGLDQWLCAILLFANLFHHHQPALRAGDAASNSQQIPLRVNQIDAQVL